MVRWPDGSNRWSGLGLGLGLGLILGASSKASPANWELHSPALFAPERSLRPREKAGLHDSVNKCVSIRLINISQKKRNVHEHVRKKVTDSANLRKVFNYINNLHKVEILISELTAKPLILTSYDICKFRTSSAFLPARVQFFKQARDFDV